MSSLCGTIILTKAQQFQGHFPQPTAINTKQSTINTSKHTNDHTHSLILLVVFGAPGLGHEALGQLFQVARVLHFDLGLLAKEVLEVLKKLNPHVRLLLQTFLLLHQLRSDL